MLKVIAVLSCLALILSILMHRKDGHKHRVMIAFTAWLLAVGSFSYCIRVLFGGHQPDIYTVFVTSLVAAALYLSRGNVANLFKGDT